MSERLELVTAFESLKAGMIVVVKRGFHCSRSHRALVLSPGKPEIFDFDGKLTDETECWRVLPKPPCCNREWAVITPMVIAARRVYRVVDGLEASSSTTTTTKAPRRERV